MGVLRLPMRLGVSAKVFLAYTALVAAFVVSSIFTIVTTSRAREQVLASQVYFELQSHTDAALRQLAAIDTARRRRSLPDPTLWVTFEATRAELRSGARTITRLLEREPGSRLHDELTLYGQRLEAVDKTLAELQGELKAFEAGEDAEVQRRFTSKLVTLQYTLDSFKKTVNAESLEATARLQRAGETARRVSGLLGGVGVLIALGAAAVLWRTLRPLRILRERARAVAGGDYASRVGVHSKDEIGDLAREFDAMAVAIEEREQRLIRSERLATVGRMAAHVTHEVRNPLASIGLYAELLADELPTAEAEGRRLAASIASEVDRLSQITDTYLRFVRLPRPEREPEDLGTVVREAVAFFRAELELARVRVEVETDGTGALSASVDENQIRQALLNLMRNAREAMPDGGVLTIGVARRADDGGDVIEIAVRDTGGGIPPEHVAKIFDPFFSTKDKGTGLGLALVQQIMVEHQGRVEVASSSEGTTFRLIVPALEADRRAEAEPVAAAAGAR